MRHLATYIIFFWVAQLHILHAQPICDYIAYDGFITSQNQVLHQSSSGNGWKSAWEVQNDNIDVNGYYIGNSNTIAYLDLPVHSNVLKVGNGYLRAGRLFDVSNEGSFSAFIVPYSNAIGKAGKTLFLSYLFQFDQVPSNNAWVALHGSNTGWYEGQENYLQIGYFGNESNQNNEKYWGIKFNNQAVNLSSKTIQANETVLVVLSLNWITDENCEVKIYLNPTALNQSVPPVSHISTIISPFKIKGFNMYVEGTGLGKIDEIRASSSYQCAVPDANTIINLPPLAQVNSNLSEGLQPLSVNFDGSFSFDPDGSISSYFWDFGDGGFSNSTSSNHTFKHLGENLVKLTVTDNEGKSNSTQTLIKVKNSEGVYPCKSFVQGTIESSCSMNNAVLKLDIQNGENYELKNQLNEIQSPFSTTYPVTYQNLIPGLYQLTFSKLNGCETLKNLTIGIDSSTCIGFSKELCDMRMGIGIGGIADWERERPFKNYFLTAREGPLVFTDTSTNCCLSYLNEFMTFDTSGYLTHVPFYKSGEHEFKIRYVLSTDNQLPNAQYLLRYDGLGIIDIEGVSHKIVDLANKKISFEVLGNQNIFITIDSSQSGDHIRNIRVTQLKDTSSYDSQPFNLHFLNLLKQFSTVRFMDWQNTNGNPMVQWSDRRKKSYYTQASYQVGSFKSNGIAYEWIIDLANEIKKDIWLCIPHQADSAFIAEMAVLFKNGLKYNQNIFLEYSNEVWNPQFPQYQYVNSLGPNHLDTPYRYAIKARDTFKIWMNAWGLNPSRIKRVIGAWSGNSYNAQTMMTYLDANDYDYISPSFYFGHEAVNAANPANPLEIIDKARIDFLTTDGPKMKEHYLLARLHNKGLVNYEGGQHIISKQGYEAAAYQSQILPEMYDLYEEVLDSIRQWGSELAMAYILTGRRDSPYGSWGHLEDPFQNLAIHPAPKFAALMDNTCRREPCRELAIIEEDLLAKENQFEASQKIQINASLADNTRTSLFANNEVLLLPGFNTNTGGIFKAEIRDCN